MAATVIIVSLEFLLSKNSKEKNGKDAIIYHPTLIMSKNIKNHPAGSARRQIYRALGGRDAAGSHVLGWSFFIEKTPA
jgi:hypothetical protein